MFVHRPVSFYSSGTAPSQAKLIRSHIEPKSNIAGIVTGRRTPITEVPDAPQLILSLLVCNTRRGGGKSLPYGLGQNTGQNLQYSVEIEVSYPTTTVSGPLPAKMNRQMSKIGHQSILQLSYYRKMQKNKIKGFAPQPSSPAEHLQPPRAFQTLSAPSPRLATCVP